jgi:hypothetical protein
LSVVSTLVALAAAYAALMVAFARRAPKTVTFTPIELLVMVVILAVALGAHEGVHGLVISTYGGRPRFGWAFVARVLPYLYCTAPRQRFAKPRYAVVALAPSLFVSLALIVGLRSPAGVLFVIPFAIHLGVCMNDWVVTCRALREPRGSLIEDVADGILIHPPPIMA